jgi:hypothetical protein
LTDENGTLVNEAKTYRRRLMLDEDEKTHCPHISIAKVELAVGTEEDIADLFEWVKLRLPDKITLNVARVIAYPEDRPVYRLKKSTVRRQSDGLSRRAF